MNREFMQLLALYQRVREEMAERIDPEHWQPVRRRLAQCAAASLHPQCSEQDRSALRACGRALLAALEQMMGFMYQEGPDTPARSHRKARAVMALESQRLSLSAAISWP